MASPVKSLCKELIAKVGYGNIACKLWGDNIASNEKFLAVHGWLDNAGSFDPLLEYFAGTGKCVACIDMPGHGLSSHLPKGLPYSPATDLLGMRAMIKHLGWTKYNLIGHSMGSMRAQQYMLCYPGEVSSVVALDGVVMPSEFTPGAPYQAFGRQTDKFIKYNTEHHGREREHTWQELADRWLAAVKDLREEDFNILMKRGSRKLDNGKYVYTRDTALHNRANVLLMQPMEVILESMKKVKDCPILYIHSELGNLPNEHAKETFISYIKRIETELPETVENVYYGGAHHFHMQQPEEISSIITDFLLRKKAKSDSSV